jgi:cell division septation protein DedD
MAKKSDGGFEVLLGDTQLLSLFVIVVVLLAVFFTMGYVLGRHSGAASTDAIASKEPAVQMSPRAAPSESPVPASNPASAPAESAAEPAVPAPAPEARIKPPAREPAPPAAPLAPTAGQTFLQVAASKDAAVVANVLKKKGFPTVLAPSPIAGVFRVLVGPLADKSTVASTRARLEKAGFDGAIVVKY